ncbi:hypothetical protein ACF052_33180 [Streptomyces pilosus]|uniref:hypothetical protein n=1 Tax=Streptomyces pilosus TaxID=28893 RepID=UPI0036FFD8FC
MDLTALADTASLALEQIAGVVDAMMPANWRDARLDYMLLAPPVRPTMSTRSPESRTSTAPHASRPSTRPPRPPRGN